MKREIMKYLPAILVILFILIPGCLESSGYKEISRSQLLSNPDVFEGKKICTDLIYENNGFYLEFTTPSCEECSALSPGEYAINATVTVSGKTFETYKKITLAREDSNISKNGSEIVQVNNTRLTNKQLNDKLINDTKAYDAQAASTYGIPQSNETILVEY